MPGPGPHMLYALGTGQVLTTISNGRFSPHHSLTYAINAFLGPDLGSFSQWLASTFVLGQTFASYVEQLVHHPFYYVLLLGIPLSILYSWVSKVLLRKRVLDSVSGVPLSRKQCLLLISAGSLSHFFLDHLFEENGHSSMYSWILSTGWWESHAAVNPDAVIVVGFLCTSLICGFIYINRVKSLKSVRTQSMESVCLIGITACLLCLWCASQIYFVNPRRAPVGEEADLGVVVFLGIYFFLPHGLCIMSMGPKQYLGSEELLPL